MVDRIASGIEPPSLQPVDLGEQRLLYAFQRNKLGQDYTCLGVAKAVAPGTGRGPRRRADELGRVIGRLKEFDGATGTPIHSGSAVCETAR